MRNPEPLSSGPDVGVAVLLDARTFGPDAPPGKTEVRKEDSRSHVRGTVSEIDRHVKGRRVSGVLHQT